jgi:DNA mismatch repair protein MutS2
MSSSLLLQRPLSTSTTRGLVASTSQQRRRHFPFRKSSLRAREEASSSATDARNDEENNDEEVEEREEDIDALHREALSVLQWHLVSRTVSKFCETSLGRRKCSENFGGLALKSTREECEEELRVTSGILRLLHRASDDGKEVRRKGLNTRRRDYGYLDGCFEGCKDARMFLEGAKRGQTLSAGSFVDVYTTLMAMEKVCEEIFGTIGTDEGDDDDTDVKALRKATESLRACRADEKVQAMKKEIERCINVDIATGALRNDASEDLAHIRTNLSSTAKTLRKTLNDIANEMAQKKFAERAQIVTRLGRECIPMKLGSAGQLKGIVLATSDSGATVFKEPEEVIALNNFLSELKELEEMEIEVILKRLTNELKEVADVIQEALEVGMTTADLANAKARHSRWISGSRPVFMDSSSASSDKKVSITNAQHPLLLEKYLPNLPNFLDDDDEDDVNDKQKAWDKLAPGSFYDENAEESAEEGNVGKQGSTRFDCQSKIVPIDFHIDTEASAVAITGPNTGGKTASLKTLGILILMSRAGMYPPCGVDGSEPQQQEEQPQILPFVRTVACDLGDSQTLQLGDGGLSTFGAHIRRLKRILESPTEESLVLLDEPGSGTDPREGAALAVAVASAVAKKSKLLVLTSHFEEVKQFALAVDENDNQFRVAAVRFDVENNRPTYELVWGKTEDSNALSISRGLGLDGDLLEEATQAHAKMFELEMRNTKKREQNTGKSLDEEDEDANLAESLRLEREEQRLRFAQATESLERAQQLKAKVFRETNFLRERVNISKERFELQSTQSIEEAKSRCEAATTLAEVEEIVQETFPDGFYMNARGEIALEDEGGNASEYVPKPKDKVLVKMLGGAEAEVVSVDLAASECTVRIGSLVTRSPLNGISKATEKQVFGRSK